MLIQSTASFNVAESRRADFPDTATTFDPHYYPSDLNVAITALPPHGRVLLADGATPVGLGQTVTLPQLATLQFALDDPSAHWSSMCVWNDSAAQAIVIDLTNAFTAESETAVRLTDLPSNGTVLLADGETIVEPGSTLTPQQFAGLVFKPSADATGQLSTLCYCIVDTAGRHIHGYVLVIVGPATPALAGAAHAKPVATAVSIRGIAASVGLAALLDLTLPASSSELSPLAPQKDNDTDHASLPAIVTEETSTSSPTVAQAAASASSAAAPATVVESLVTDLNEHEPAAEELPTRIGSSSLPLPATPASLTTALAAGPSQTGTPAASATASSSSALQTLTPQTNDWTSLVTPGASSGTNGQQDSSLPAPFATGSAMPTASLPATGLQGGLGAPPAGGPVSGPPNATQNPIDEWSAAWRAAASAAPCGTCAGMACSQCSIVIGGPSRPNGQPTGYDPTSVVRNLDPSSTVGGANDLTGAIGGLLTPNSGSSSSSTSSFAATASNAIVLENMKPGNPSSEWLIDQHDPSIEGFAAQFSVDNGQRVDFKINTNSTNYRIDIYRIGYYGGDGARRVATINRNLATPQVQPVPVFDPTRRLVDAGNWSVSASWDVPTDAVSGVYFAKLTRLDGNGGANMIPFIVRDDENPSDITFQTSDTTWQAYNWWGGYNLYGGIDQAGREGRASAVSYNRPFITRDGGFAAGPQDFIFSVEYPAIRWLEQNGYDINYISGIDTARSGAQLLNSEIFLSVGHDEYWSADQRANVEAARDAGVDLAFWGGNNVYWQTRWEASIDGTGTPYKTLVSYKERWARDNVDVNGTTSTWRDPQFGSGNTENALMGTMFTVDSYRLDTLTIPYSLSNFRFWNNTAVGNIQPGQVYSLVPNLLGYEWDSDVDNGSRPAGLINLSSSTVNVEQLLLDYGNTTGPGTATHNLTLYRAPSGALVFGAGTVYWSWGLDENHDLEVTPTDRNVQQAMVNLFADMGVQPATLMTSLVVASQTTDNAKPTSTITSPTTGGSYLAARPITISGTATDAGGGLIAVVEVSTDNGTTWHRATGFENWTYTWVPTTGGTYTIRSRAVDDSVNLETPSAGRTITVQPAPVWSLIPQSATPAILSDSDVGFVNLGMRFTASEAGSVAGVRYYKGLGDGGTHVGSLWTATGTLLASATFTQETDSGWQTVTFASPVSITAGTPYVVSYRSSGHYASTNNYFTGAISNGPLSAPASNGYYTYNMSTAFPSTASNGTNYFVDVIFAPTNVTNQPPTATTDSGFATTRDTPITIAASALLANDSDPNGDPLTITGVSGATNGSVNFNAQNNTITFTPTAGYTGTGSFSYAISDSRGGTASATVNLSVQAPFTTVSLFSPSDTPAVTSSSDTSQVNLGVRFTSSLPGTVTGIRYYRGVNDLGTHTGSLWTATGALLASATFTNETASGWQQVNFATPVSITAGTTYVASYHSNGRYAITSNYFTTNRVSGPLTAPAGNNGVYAYGTGNLFPTSTFNASNYWVDVVFAGANQPPVATNDGGFITSLGTPITIAASALLANDTDPNGDTLAVTGASGSSTGSASFNSQNNTITFTPALLYVGQATFTYTISDGRGGTANGTVNVTVNPPGNQPPTANGDSGFTTARNTTLNIAANSLLSNDTDPNGDPLTITGAGGATNGTVNFNAQTNTVSFTPTTGYTGPASFNYTISDGRGGTSNAAVSLTVTLPVTSVSLFSPSDTPANVNNADTAQVNLGVRFTSSQAGHITGIRYYRGVNDLGTHTGSLWSSTGTLLATATFTNETASGWQQVNFATPVSITAGTTYVASYHSNGRYTSTTNYFTSSRVNGPLTAPSGNNGVYAYGNGNLFPTSTFGATNYWVDVVFSAPGAANQPPVATNDSGFSTQQNTTLNIAASALLANDTDPNGDSLTISGVGGAVNGSVSFNSQTNTVSFTPNTGYTGSASFTYTISDSNGGTASANAALVVTDPTTHSFFSTSTTPSIVTVNDTSSVELGFKFQASSSGQITGMRFYKGPQNTGPHVANLWTASGSLLASATFTNETSSGWQQVNFSTPVTISAGTTYVASYHTNGNYSADPNYFATARTSGPLTAPSSASSGGNGVYAYGGSSLFPTNSYNATSYGVDVLFRAQIT